MYLAGKWGKKAVRGFERIVAIDNRVDVGVITLHKGNFDYVTVYGSVMDSETGKPVEDASVVATSNSLVVIDVDSTHTDDDGTFSMSIKVERTGVVRPTATYSIGKRGYYFRKGTAGVIGDTIHIGKVELVKDGTPIQLQYQKRVVAMKPDKIEVYSLKGQMLYSGKPLDGTATLYGYFGRQLCVIHYKKDNQLLGTRKITQMR
jgi:hypothetical protein